MSDKHSGTQVIIAVIGLLTALVGLGGVLIANWDTFFGDDDTTTTSAAAEPGTTEATSPPRTSGTTQPPATAGTTATTASSGGCFVTIENPLVPLKEEPDTFSPDVGSVPAGDHPVIESTIVTFGTIDQRWLKIDIGGQQGWIRDSIIQVKAKSSECDF